jgi:hypothetical protein
VTRFACLLAAAALVAGGSLSCSSSSESSGSTTATIETTAQTESTAAPAPPPAQLPRPPSAAKRKRVYAELARLRDRGATGPAIYRRVARQEDIGVDRVMLIEREGSLKRWALPAAPKLPKAAVRVPPSRAAATRLRSSVRCSSNAPRTGIARLRWRAVRRPGRRQWIAVTIFLRGFALGSFEASRPLANGVSSFEWRRVHGQAIHYWRVITRDRNGRWLGSSTASFTGPTCIAEFQP